MSFLSVHLVVAHPALSVVPTLQSLGAQTRRDIQIVVVDNASQDVQIPWSHGGGPEVMLLRNFRDQGFARAHNQALSSLFARWPQETWKDRYIMLLSSRVLLAPDAIEYLYRAFEEHPDIQVASPKVHRAHLQMVQDGDELQRIDSEIFEQTGVELTRGLEPRSRGAGEKDVDQYDEKDEAFLPGTWCLMIRADALMRAKVGDEWLDGDLPEAWAMADLAWRFRLLQMPMKTVPLALAWIQAASSQTRRGWLERVRAWYGAEALRVRAGRSYACVLRLKNASWGAMFMAFPWIGAAWVSRLFVLVLDPRAMSEVLRSWAIIPRAWRKRRFLQLAIRQSRG